jgi:hypothetical protein
MILLCSLLVESQCHVRAALVSVFLPVDFSYEWLSVSPSHPLSVSVSHVPLILVSDGTSMSLFWSTSPGINQLYSSSLRSSTIKSLEVDENEDGLTDRLEINLLIPLSDDESITSLDGLIFSEIKLQQKARYLYDAVSHISIRSGGEGMSQVYVDGNIIIRQAGPFIARGG